MARTLSRLARLVTPWRLAAKPSRCEPEAIVPSAATFAISLKLARREIFYVSERMVSRREFRDFFSGRGGSHLVVARIPMEIGAFISAQTDTVRMERSYAEKMLTKHRLTFEHLRIVQMAIDRGACFTSAKANHLTFIYFDIDYRKTCYLLVIKSANYGQEVWFVSLYRMREDQIRAIRRKQKMLRDYHEED